MTKSITRRDFLKQTGLAGGGLIFLPLGRILANGFWEEHAWVDKAGKAPYWNMSPGVAVGEGVRANYPVIHLFDQRMYVALTEQHADKELIRIYVFDENLKQAGSRTALSDFPINSRPFLGSDGQHLYVFWLRKSGKNGEIVFQDINQISDTPPKILAKCSGNSGWIRTAASPDGDMMVVWQDGSQKPYQCRYSLFKDGKPGQMQTLKSDFPVRHPDVIFGGDAFYVAAEYGVKDFQSQIYLSRISKKGNPDETIRITDHPAGNYYPSLALLSTGDIALAYYSPRKGKQHWDMPRWVYLSLYNGRKVRHLETLPGMDLSKELTDQSLEYPRLAALDSGQLFLTGRPSQNFFIQVQGEKGFEKPCRLEQDGWGGRGLTVELAVSGNTVYTVRRDLRKVILQKIEVRHPEGRMSKLKSFPAADRIPALKNPSYENYRNVYPKIMGGTVFFGDLHHHTAYSDGIGDPDEYYTRARNLFGDDFFCLTDHDNFVGRPMQPGDWQMMKDVADYYNADDVFATFYGIEWTTGRYPNRGYGHRNIYSIHPDMPLIDHTREPWKSSKDLLREIQAFDGIAVPHHIGWTGTDWENADDVRQPLCEIISNHGAYEFMGNRPIQHRGGKKGCFMQDGLAGGHKFGLIGSTDSHGLIWHHRAGYKRNCIRSGLTAVIAEDLNRESLFQAMKRRHTYATSGIKLFLRFECENGMQGDVLSIMNVPEFSVECISPDPILRIVMVKNNSDVYEYGGDGLRSRFTWTDPNPVPGKESWYYLRITTLSGEMAWSSPIWITPLI
ncbi:MAG: CehA/McbA family metallohydrolase [Candidatus Marinimicrobia bacterium]|nr:CehA/McbA family metallohydrolase [Candidatus Neomarinimicrobiota bacterium]